MGKISDIWMLIEMEKGGAPFATHIRTCARTTLEGDGARLSGSYSRIATPLSYLALTLSGFPELLVTGDSVLFSFTKRAARVLYGVVRAVAIRRGVSRMRRG